MASTSGNSNRPRENSRHVFAALAFAAVLLFWHLGARGLNEPDEGRYASVALRMLDSRDWLHPIFNGQPHLTKPPMTYWVMAANFRMFGATEWAARLHAALAAWGVLLLTADLARRWFGSRAARDTVLILATAPLFFVLARLADPNMLMTFWVMLGFWSWATWQETGSPWRLAVLYLALGLGFFTKGPVATILTLFGIASFRWKGGPAFTSRRAWSWLGLLAASAIGLWWFVWEVSNEPALARYYLGHELVARLASRTLHRNEPAWFSAAALLAGFLPWLPLLYRGFRRTSWRDRADPMAPLLMWVGLGLLLFTLSRSKLATYVLPLIPPLALAASAAIHRQSAATVSPRVVPVSAIALGLLLLAMHDVAYPHLLREHERLSAAALLAEVRAAGYRDGHIFFSHAPAATYFYLRPAGDPQWIGELPGTHDLPKEDRISAAFNSFLERAQPNDLLLLSSEVYDRVTDREPMESRTSIQARNQKYTALQLAAPRAADQADDTSNSRARSSARSM